MTLDVAVIGGGIVGTAIAAFLAEAGARVVLWEREAIGAGASGRNSGVVQHPSDSVLADLYHESVAIYRELDGFDLPATPAGLLYVGLDPSPVEGLARDVRIGYPVPPAAATRAFAARAERAGAEIRIGAGARLWRASGRAAGVEVDGRRFATDAVVVAAGPWSPSIVDPTGAWRPIRSLWGVVATIDLPGPPRYVLEEVAIEEGIAPGGEPSGVEFSLVTADGASSLGSTFLFEASDAQAIVPRLVEHGARFVPAIAGAPLVSVRSCARPLSVDGRPLVGAVPGIAGLWIVAGHGPWGISTGPASARRLTSAILGRPEQLAGATDPARMESPFGA